MPPFVYALLVGHFVGDFIYQSDWMAENKSKRWDVLAAHVAVYTLVIGAALVPFVGVGDHLFINAADGLVLRFILVNGAAHFVQDAITSRITARLWFLPKVGQGMQPTWIQVDVKPTRHWFFVALGADQMLHYVTLFVTAQWWLR